MKRKREEGSFADRVMGTLVSLPVDVVRITLDYCRTRLTLLDARTLQYISIVMSHDNDEEWSEVSGVKKAIRHNSSSTSLSLTADNVVVIDFNNAEGFWLHSFCPRTGNLYRVFSSHSWHSTLCRVVDSHLYFLGGCNPEPTTLCRAFDIRSKVWGKDLYHLQVARDSAAGAVKGPLIYVLGGFAANTDLLQSCEIFDTRSRKSSLAPFVLPIPLEYPATVVHEDYLYVFGGTTQFRMDDGIVQYSRSSSTWRLSLVTHTWTKLSNVPRSLDAVNSRCYMVGDVVWVYGGFTRCGKPRELFCLDTQHLDRGWKVKPVPWTTSKGEVHLVLS